GNENGLQNPNTASDSRRRFRFLAQRLLQEHTGLAAPPASIVAHRVQSIYVLIDNVGFGLVMAIAEARLPYVTALRMDEDEAGNVRRCSN
ncbi:hypothetical protein PMAYCL1PPCAC_01607, partial [Pristionchus mayeri]